MNREESESSRRYLRSVGSAADEAMEKGAVPLTIFACPRFGIMGLARVKRS